MIEFQNISCLRLMRFDYINAAQIILFQNISCLRLICNSGLLEGCYRISKHFMFTVNIWDGVISALNSYFKTFHVYG